jgi:hypothetical protein
VQTATVNVTIDPVNDAPEAANDVNSTDEDTTLNVAAPGVIGNDSDFDDDPLTAVKVTDPAHGTLTLNADGSYNYKLQVVSSSCEELTLPFLVVVCWNFGWFSFFPDFWQLIQDIPSLTRVEFTMSITAGLDLKACLACPVVVPVVASSR